MRHAYSWQRSQLTKSTVASVAESRSAFSRLDNWRSGDSPQRWLFTIMHNLFIDQKRRALRRKQALPLSQDVGDSIVSPPTQFESVVSREVFDALQTIAPERREALLLVAVEGLT